jgi:hypothetical protein
MECFYCKTIIHHQTFCSGCNGYFPSLHQIELNGRGTGFCEYLCKNCKREIPHRGIIETVLPKVAQDKCQAPDSTNED